MTLRHTVGHDNGACGRDDSASVFIPLTWRLRVCCSWGLRVGLPPGLSRSSTLLTKGRRPALRAATAGPADQNMERMEVDQCAGAAGGTGGGALRRSNSAPMITSVRSVVLQSNAQHSSNIVLVYGPTAPSSIWFFVCFAGYSVNFWSCIAINN